MTVPTRFPRVPLKQMDAAMLVFELDRETSRVLVNRDADEEHELITAAATMASFLHRRQTRFVRGDLPRTPYIEHPLRVALRLLRWGATDASLIAAALLHDVIEDCTPELLSVFGAEHEGAWVCLERLYSRRVAGLVLEVTHSVGCINPDGYLEHIEQMIGSSSDALLIKASDLKDNAGSIRHQLGHGKDQKLLRLLKKYLPAVERVSVALRERADNNTGPLWSRPVVRNAAVDLEQLLEDLTELSEAHGIAAHPE